MLNLEANGVKSFDISLNCGFLDNFYPFDRHFLKDVLKDKRMQFFCKTIWNIFKKNLWKYLIFSINFQDLEKKKDFLLYIYLIKKTKHPGFFI